jgi:hypothetical protein
MLSNWIGARAEKASKDMVESFECSVAKVGGSWMQETIPLKNPTMVSIPFFLCLFFGYSIEITDEWADYAGGTRWHGAL